MKIPGITYHEGPTENWIEFAGIPWAIIDFALILICLLETGIGVTFLVFGLQHSDDFKTIVGITLISHPFGNLYRIIKCSGNLQKVEQLIENKLCYFIAILNW